MSVRDKLGATGWYPIPGWLRLYLRTQTPSRQRVTMARLLLGKDLSFLAPDELGCAESVSRIDNALFGDRIILGTGELLEYYLTSSTWKEIPYPVIGCTCIAATGTGKPGTRGHVWINDAHFMWSNNSMRKVWDNHWTHSKALAEYQTKNGMKMRYFIKINK